MYLQIVEVIATKQLKKVVRIEEGTTEIVYNGDHFSKSVYTKNGRQRTYDYYSKSKHPDRKPIPATLKKLVEEMDFVLDSLVEKDHVRVVIEK